MRCVTRETARTDPGRPGRGPVRLLGQRPAEVLSALARQLRPVGRFYICSDGVLGVLSLPAVSVWSNGRVLSWRESNGEMAWPAADAEGAARRLAGHARPRRGGGAASAAG